MASAIQISNGQLRAVVDRAWQQVWPEGASSPIGNGRCEHVEALVYILERNLSGDRYRNATGAQSPTRSDDSDLWQYARRVATHYGCERSRVIDLALGDEAVWEQLRRRMLRQARRILQTQFGFDAPAALEQAADCVQEACAQILDGEYPWDVPLEAWVGRILINVILTRLGRSRDILDRSYFLFLDSIDQYPHADSSITWSTAGSSPLLPRAAEEDAALLSAVQQLTSEEQRMVILLGFFEGWRSDEIAAALDKSLQAIYSLRYRALDNLRKILLYPPEIAPLHLPSNGKSSHSS